jgi:hypothetical protein
MVLLDILGCHFLHRHGRTILMTFSESSFQTLLIVCSDANRPKNKCTFITPSQLAGTSQSVFPSLNCNCSVQNRYRELKLVSLEPPDNKDDEYFFVYLSTMSVTKLAMKPSGNTILCSLVGWGGGCMVRHMGPQS